MSVDDKEVDCEVNMYIRLNGEKFRKAAKFLQRSDNEWRTKGIAVDHFDQLLTDSINAANIICLLMDEFIVLSSAMSGTTSMETIQNIYQMCGLTTTARKNVDEKDEARTGWSNVDRVTKKIGRKSYRLDQSDSK